MKVGFSIEGAVGRIEFAEPPANALERPDFVDLDALQRFLATPTLKGVILVGAGRHFSGGADVTKLQQALADPAALDRGLTEGKRLLES